MGRDNKYQGMSGSQCIQNVDYCNGVLETVSGSEDRSINTQTAEAGGASCGSESSTREEGAGSPEKAGLAKANGSRERAGLALDVLHGKRTFPGEQGLMHKDLWFSSRCG